LRFLLESAIPFTRRVRVGVRETVLRRILLLSLISLSLHTAIGQTGAPTSQKTSASLEPLKFLVGKWVGDGTAETGQPGGGFCSFELKLQDQALVRNNHSEYPATKDRAAIMHDDLMIIYPDRARKQLRAFYTDNEGNLIHYTVTASSDGTGAVFLGDAEPGQRRYRLTYTTTEPGRMTVTFEMAPPDKPDGFHKFIEGKLRRSPETTQAGHGGK